MAASGGLLIARSNSARAIIAFTAGRLGCGLLAERLIHDRFRE